MERNHDVCLEGFIIIILWVGDVGVSATEILMYSQCTPRVRLIYFANTENTAFCWEHFDKPGNICLCQFL